MCHLFFFVRFYCCHNIPETIRKFSDSDDLTTLPHNRELKCYMRCLFEVSNIMLGNTTSFNYIAMMEQMNTLPEYSHKIILRMARGCLMNNKIRDLCDNAYKVHVCLKTNDKQVTNCAFLFVFFPCVASNRNWIYSSSFSIMWFIDTSSGTNMICMYSTMTRPPTSM